MCKRPYSRFPKSFIIPLIPLLFIYYFWGQLPRAQSIVAQDCFTVYTVQPGDDLHYIANRFGVTLQKLVAFNNLETTNFVDVGVTLCIPASLSRTIEQSSAESDGFAFSQQPVWESAESTIAHSLAWGDIDGDGDLDLIVANSAYNYNYGKWELFEDFELGRPNFLYLNEDGQLDSHAAWQSQPANTLGVAWGDMDGDGDLDLAEANSGLNRVYRNENSILELIWESNDRQDTQQIIWQDVNNDGRYDLVANNIDGNDVVYHNLGNDGSDPFQKESEPYLIDDFSENRGTYYSENGSVAWADIDGDGDLDRSESDLNGIQLFHAGSEHPQWLPVSRSSWRGVEAIAWADVDGDGDLDVAVGGDQTPVRLYRNNQNHYQANPPLVDLLPRENGGVFHYVSTWGDINGDHTYDLVQLADGYDLDVMRNLTDSIPLQVLYNENGLLQAPQELVEDNFDLTVNDEFGPNQIARIIEGETILDPNWWPIRSLALADVDADGWLDLTVGRLFAPNQLYRNIEGELVLEPNWWPVADSEATESVAWGDVDGDGDLDLAVGNRSRGSFLRDEWGPTRFPPGSSHGADQVFFNDGNGNLAPEPWQSADKLPTAAIHWWDYDNDGDLDLIAIQLDRPLDRLYLNDAGILREQAVLIPHQTRFEESVNLDVNDDGRFDLFRDGRIFLNNQTPIHPQYQNQPSLNIMFVEPANIAPAITSSQGNYDEDGLVTFTYQVSGPNQRRYDVYGFYSLDGGERWHEAKPTADSDIYQLVPSQQYTYIWDVFGSGVFGASDNVHFRLQVRPNFEPLTGSFAGLYQRPFAQTETLPFRIRGKQVQVFNEENEVGDENSAVSGAFVYRLPQDELAAMIMGNYETGEAFVTGENGYLSGRGELVEGDGLYATLPVTQTYHIPPRLFFPNTESYLEVPDPHSNLTEQSFTAEFWVSPLSPDGNLFSWGDDVALSYSTFTETIQPATTIDIQIGDQTTHTNQIASLVDGQLHQVAISWDKNLSTTILYLDGSPIFTATVTNTVNALSEGVGGPLNTPIGGPLFYGFGPNFIGAMDELRLWDDVRSAAEIAQSFALYNQRLITFWAIPYGTSGALLAGDEDNLIGYWPVAETEQGIIADESAVANKRNAILVGAGAVAFKPHYTVYHTSGAVTETLSFQPVITGSVQPITVSAKHPLILFDLDVSFEWDPRSDINFMAELQNSFERASELLYDVSNGQMLLRQVNFFYNKAYWGQADIVVFANNGLRPSAAIGGTANRPVSETVRTESGTKIVSDAYLPGQIRMGTVWDPFGENTADLGEEWARALAHELSHYLLFLPDNYLGYKGREGNILGLVDCQGSFMTNNIDPAYSEFLIDEEWKNDACQQTLANRTTERPDWDTIKRFYPMLNVPDPGTGTPLGPAVLPLNLIELIGWDLGDEELILDARNFILRTASANTKVRLPNAQVYLVKTQGTADLTDDLLVGLGTPTGGGDRIKVRGAAEEDRLCLLGRRDGKRYASCQTIARTDASLKVTGYDDLWEPVIDVDSRDGRILTITVSLSSTKPITSPLYIQVYPQHYMSFAGLAPIATLTITSEAASELTYAQVVTLPLPAYEIAVRVWMPAEDGEATGNNGREAITSLRLNPDQWGAFSVPLSLTLKALGLTNVAGPIIMPTGGPIIMPTGGPIIMPTGGPIIMPTGGPIIMPTGGPIIMPTGGPAILPANNTSRSSFAPILSSDAQVVVYNGKGFFEDNGITNLQALPHVPDPVSWLIPVGQAYLVESSQTFTDPRFISFNYLQRDVPEGYEHALNVYFAEDCHGRHDCDSSWRPISSTQPFIENLIVAPVQTDENDIGINGNYAVMASLKMPALQVGWNLFSFPLPVTRTVTDTLASVNSYWQLDEVYEVRASRQEIQSIVAPTVSSIHIRSGDSLTSPVVGYLRRNEGAIVIGRTGDWLEIECPYFVTNIQTRCWVTGRSGYVTESAGVNLPEELTPINSVTQNPEILQPYRVYWIKITAPSNVDIPDFYIAPPIRLPDGTLGNP